MWVWVATIAVVLACAVICGIASIRAWRQVKALTASVATVRAELVSYTDRLQIADRGSPRG